MREGCRCVHPSHTFGGKSRVAAEVWKRFGDVPNYCEPFFGSGAVLLARPHKPRTETINDACGFLVNFWRAVQVAPEAVARYADWPVSECDLHARHLWLVNEGRRRVSLLQTDPDYFDVKVAGWWVWGICQWIGSGWCSGKGPHRLNDEDAHGVSVRIPHLSDAGTGIHKKMPLVGNGGVGIHKATLDGIEKKRPHLMNDGKGIHANGVSKRLPHLGDAGRGVHRAQQGVSLQKPAIVVGGGAGVHGFNHGTTCEERAEGLEALMLALSDRLRRVRVCCGDWSRVTGPSVTFKHGLTGVFLDPPYSHAERHDECYTVETDCAAAVREWALENGDNPLMRIALCGYEGEHEMLSSWECLRWKAAGGYGSQGEGRGRENAARECVWFSPHCLKLEKAAQQGLALWEDDAA